MLEFSLFNVSWVFFWIPLHIKSVEVWPDRGNWCCNSFMIVNSLWVRDTFKISWPNLVKINQISKNWSSMFHKSEWKIFHSEAYLRISQAPLSSIINNFLILTSFKISIVCINPCIPIFMRISLSYWPWVVLEFLWYFLHLCEFIIKPVSPAFFRYWSILMLMISSLYPSIVDSLHQFSEVNTVCHSVSFFELANVWCRFWHPLMSESPWVSFSMFVVWMWVCSSKAEYGG